MRIITQTAALKEERERESEAKKFYYQKYDCKNPFESGWWGGEEGSWRKEHEEEIEVWKRGTQITERRKVLHSVPKCGRKEEEEEQKSWQEDKFAKSAPSSTSDKTLGTTSQAPTLMFSPKPDEGTQDGRSLWRSRQQEGDGKNFLAQQKRDEREKCLTACNHV